MMNTNPYREQFPNRALFPVIPVQSYEQVCANLTTAEAANVDGVFLIEHSGPSAKMLESILERLRQDGWFQKLWIGANFQTSLNHRAFSLTHQLGLDGVWTDDAYALTFQAKHDEEMRQLYNKARVGRKEKPALYFGGAALKYQPRNTSWVTEAHAANKFTDVAVTSGPGASIATEIEKLQVIQSAIGNHPLAVVGDANAESVRQQVPYVDAVLIATGDSGDPHNLDPVALTKLVEIVHSYQPPN